MLGYNSQENSVVRLVLQAFLTYGEYPSKVSCDFFYFLLNCGVLFRLGSTNIPKRNGICQKKAFEFSAFFQKVQPFENEVRQVF